MTSEKILDSIDSVEFYVGSAKQWAFFHKTAMGFKMLGYAGPETGVRDRVSYLMGQGSMKLKLTSFLDQNSSIAEHVRKHGDGVRDISFRVDNIDDTATEVSRRGVVKMGKIETVKTPSGKLRRSVVPTYGETMHTINDYSEYDDALPPDFQEVEGESTPVGIKRIDHVVGNVEEKNMDNWVRYYIDGFGFRHLISFDDKDISTEYSALRSKVVEYNNRKIIFPINEPAYGLKKSQIQEYLDYYNSPGVQHMALETDDIIKTVSDLKSRGIEFLYTPDSYYNDLKDRVGSISEDVEKLKKLRILVDRDDKGYLLQIFTKPMGDRPTFFYEIIQRKGAISFGNGNFKALFRSIELEQAKRGNL